MRSLLLLVAIASTAAAEPPKAVTQAWLRQQARASFPILDSVDPAKGLVVIEHVTDVADDSIPTKQTAELLCGDALKKRLPALKKAMKAMHASSDIVSCHNRKDSSECSFHFAFEYSTSYTLVLKKNAAGVLVPDAVLVLDAGSMNEEAYTQMNTWVNGNSRKVRAKSCVTGASAPR